MVLGYSPFGILFPLFTISFVLTPYWYTGGSIAYQGWVCALLIASGYLWAMISGGRAPFRSVPFVLFRRSVVWIVGLALLLYGRFLVAEIPWRGDEEYHIDIINEFSRRISSSSFLGIFLLGIIFEWVEWRGNRKRWILFFAALAFGIVQAVVGFCEPLPRADIARYLALSRYLMAIPVAALQPFSATFHEWTFRIVPFFSFALPIAAMACQMKTICGRILYALFLLTIPIASFYAALAYIEPLCFALLVVVLFDIDALLELPRADVRRRFSWLALLSLGFMKETVAPILASFLIVRIVVQLRKHSVPRRRIMMEELLNAFSLLFPLILYLYFRNHVGSIRTFSPKWSQLAPFGEWGKVFARSYVEQFGAMCTFAWAGFFLLAKQKKSGSLLFIVLGTLSVTLMVVLDEQGHIGYSRFNLIPFAFVFYLGNVAVDEIRKLHPKWLMGILIAGIAMHLWLSPLHPDGSRKSYWGIYVHDVGEHSYPYREALEWVNQHPPRQKLLSTGLDYNYPVYHYLSPDIDWRQFLMDREGVDESRLKFALEIADRKSFDLVLFHPLQERTSLRTSIHGFQGEKTFCNVEHCLWLYRKDKSIMD